MARLRNALGVVVTTSDDNVERLGAGWESLDDAAVTGYEAMTVDELKDEIRRRNDDGRDDDARLALTGAKADLVASLEADDA